MKNTKLKDILGPLKSVINAALPLVEVPPLYQVRNTLMFEFPYAAEVIDFALVDLVGRDHRPARGRYSSSAIPAAASPDLPAALERSLA